MKSPGSRPGTFLQHAGSAIPPPFSHSGKSSSPTHWEYRTLCLTLSEQLHTRSDRDQGSLQTRFPAPTIFQTHLMRARLFFWKTVSSAWFVDSAIRWRRNGAVGLRKIVVRLRLFRAGFWRFCNSQNCASRSLPTRRLAASAFAGLTPAGCVRFIQKERTLFSSQTLLHGQRRRCSRAEASGASFASLRRAGLRLARLKPVFISASCGRPEHLFLPPPRVAASCIFQSAAEFANNSVVRHSEEIGRSTKNLIPDCPS